VELVDGGDTSRASEQRYSGSVALVDRGDINRIYPGLVVIMNSCS